MKWDPTAKIFSNLDLSFFKIFLISFWSWSALSCPRSIFPAGTKVKESKRLINCLSVGWLLLLRWCGQKRITAGNQKFFILTFANLRYEIGFFIAAVVGQRLSTNFVMKRLWVRILQDAALFTLFTFSVVCPYFRLNMLKWFFLENECLFACLLRPEGAQNGKKEKLYSYATK